MFKFKYSLLIFLLPLLTFQVLAMDSESGLHCHSEHYEGNFSFSRFFKPLLPPCLFKEILIGNADREKRPITLYEFAYEGFFSTASLKSNNFESVVQKMATAIAAKECSWTPSFCEIQESIQASSLAVNHQEMMKINHQLFANDPESLNTKKNRRRDHLRLLISVGICQTDTEIPKISYENETKSGLSQKAVDIILLMNNARDDFDLYLTNKNTKIQINSLSLTEFRKKIIKNYLQISRRYHPDKLTSLNLTTAEVNAINDTYKKLTTQYNEIK